MTRKGSAKNIKSEVPVEIQISFNQACELVPSRRSNLINNPFPSREVRFYNKSYPRRAAGEETFEMQTQKIAEKGRACISIV